VGAKLRKKIIQTNNLSKNEIIQTNNSSKNEIFQRNNLPKNEIIQTNNPKKRRFRTCELSKFGQLFPTRYILSVCFFYALFNSNPQATFTEENSHDYTIYSQSLQSYTIIGLSF